MSYTDRNDEKDDFWNLEKLVPKKKSALRQFASSAPVKDYTIDNVKKADSEKSITSNTSVEERKLSFESMKGISETEDKTYYPENSLIKSITVKKYIEKYDFYDSFRKSAILYYDCPGEKCAFAQFYSYMPQYSQLTKPQKDYYFYWRSEMRKGRFIKTDYSYLYLCVYEIINLPDLVAPKDGIMMLCRLWKEYRTDLPRIDMYFSIWVRDYCLVHELPCPFFEIKDFIFDVIRVSDFKEYYFGDLGKTTRAGVWTLIAYLSDYDWHKGLYSVVMKNENEKDAAEKQELYKTHFEGAMRVILPFVWEICLKEKDKKEPSKISRNAFPNTLCTHSVKCKLEIEYYPLAEVSGIREDITAAVRYTENKLRALFGLKSRIAIKYIPDRYRELIDCYFAELITKAEKEAKKRSLPEYEKLYEAPREKLSFEGADEIERLSWNTTMRLCDTVEDKDYETEADNEKYEKIENIIEQKVDSTLDDISSDIQSYGLTKEEIDYINSLCSGNNVYSGSIPEESLVEKINEAFSDGFGDIIIESSEIGYAIIEDYLEEITEWLKKF